MKVQGNLNILGNIINTDYSNFKTSFNDLSNLVSQFPQPPRNNLQANRLPTVNDDSTQGYSNGSQWVFGSSAFLLKDDSEGVAEWILLEDGAGISTSTSEQTGIVGLKTYNYTTYQSYIDVPVNFATYENYNFLMNLYANTSGVRIRFQLLDLNKSPIITPNYFWSGSSINSQNQSSNEYGSNSTDGILTGGNLNNESGNNSIILSISASKLLNSFIHLSSRFSYLDVSSYFTNGRVDNLHKYSGNILNATYSQSSVYTTGLDANFSKMTDGNFATGAGTSSVTGSYILIDLGSIKNISKVYVGSPNSSLPGGWSGSYMNGQLLQYSKDGSNWTTLLTLPSFSDGELRNYSINDFARYIRLYKDGYVVATEFYVTEQVTNINYVTGIRIYASSGSIKGNIKASVLKPASVEKATYNTIRAKTALTKLTSLSSLSKKSLLTYN